MNMRLLGARTIDDLVPEMVDASALNQHIVAVPTDHLFEQTCESSVSSSSQSVIADVLLDQPLQVTKFKL